MQVRENAIRFVVCVNDNHLYRKCRQHIRNLIVPQGYRLDIAPIRSATSMTKAYNLAMHESQAKYKIYLHQDVFIVNVNFTQNMIDLFKTNEKLGMFGMVGAKYIPANGVWWESTQKYGKVSDGKKLLSFGEVIRPYEGVLAVDGLLMATQFDVPWCESKFTGWHFYDLSQSLEFVKAGYEVGVPKQEVPWCIHKCGRRPSRHNWERYRRRFVEGYKKYLSSKGVGSLLQ